MEIKKFGTIYLDGWPYKPGTQYNGEVLSIRDSVPDRSIPFVKWKNLWVASQCACFNTTWLALDHFDFIYGHPVKIDGKSYLCRSLKVGSEEGVPNEWDNIIDEFGEDNELLAPPDLGITGLRMKRSPSLAFVLFWSLFHVG